MANLPTQSTFYAENYPNAPAWFKEFISKLTLFTKPVYDGLNGALTFQQNFNAQLYSVTLTGGASPSANTFNFLLTTKSKPAGLVLVAVNYTSNIATPVVEVIGHPSWYSNGNVITVSAIPGLANGTQYNLTILVF